MIRADVRLRNFDSVQISNSNANDVQLFYDSDSFDYRCAARNDNIMANLGKVVVGIFEWIIPADIF